MGMSDFYGSSSEAENLRVLDRAADIGCTFWDTSDMYGPFANEILLSTALAGRRDRITLATKFGICRGEDGSWQGIRGNADYVKAACDASLKRLGTNHIDLYYQHRVDPETPIEETVGAMAELVQEGKVRFLGLSEARPETIRRAHAVYPISALQTEYSLWSREPEASILPAVRDLGIGFVAYSPLGRGFLTGRFKTAEDVRAAGDFRSRHPRFQGKNLQRNRAIVEALEAMAAEKDLTAAQLALAWVLHRGADIVPIPGTKRVRYLEENIGASGVALTGDDIARLDAAAPVGATAGDRYADMSTVDG